MFTGLVEEIGVVKGISKGTKGAKLTIKAKKVIQGINLGDSICSNGVCLTVTEFNGDSFEVDVMAETMRRSNLSKINIGDSVNLERALRADGRLGGHIVSGHIDGTGEIVEYEKEDNAVWISIKADSSILRYIVQKGSIAIDGVSLTVAYIDNEVFKVSIIPHTGEETTLLKKVTGAEVNLECDIIGKYVEKLLGLSTKVEEKKSSLSEDFLRLNGFM